VSVSADMMDINGTDIPGYSWDAKPAWIASSKFVYLVDSGTR
jgi:hypothetical protein